jgi:deoxycytidine triphosphate deaminase
MQALAKELQEAMELRLRHLEKQVASLRGRIGAGQPGIRDALDLVAYYPGWVRDFFERENADAPDDAARVELARQILVQVVERVGLVEDWFRSEADISIPLSLLRAVERACEELELGERESVLPVGSPDNYETLVSDLHEVVFSGLGPGHAPPALPPNLASRRFAMVKVPRLEGGEALWRPIVLGHELAHLRVIDRRVVEHFSLMRRLDWSRFDGATLPVITRLGATGRLTVFRIAQNWVEELLCDAYAARRFGPAGVAALSEFLDVVGATGSVSETHPPAWLRIRLLTAWLGPVHDARLQRVVQPWVELAQSPKPALEAWAGTLLDVLEELRDDFLAEIDDWPQPYQHAARGPLVALASDDLGRGVPVLERYATQDQQWDVSEEDAINAGWVARSERQATPGAALVGKSLDTFEFLRQWTEAGGGRQRDEQRGMPAEGDGVLSELEILTRIASRDERQIVVTPLLPDCVRGVGLDVHLGARFIVFQRTLTASFDPLEVAFDPRSMQEEVERAWGERFVLHPNELVLAATLEYLALPGDLSAHVVTRSSYGRLGLITATAVLVHPHFRGCLTLELLNMGEVPLELTPGQRIAQLTFLRVSPPAPEPEEKYYCPVGPEFSRVREDAETGILRAMRERTHRDQ